MMTRRNFVKKYRDVIDRYVIYIYGNIAKPTSIAERLEYVETEEVLMYWARAEGCRI